MKQLNNIDLTKKDREFVKNPERAIKECREKAAELKAAMMEKVPSIMAVESMRVKFNSVFYAAVGFFICKKFKTSMVMKSVTQIPAINEANCPASTDCWFSCTTTQVPGGATGVELKSYAP